MNATTEHSELPGEYAGLLRVMFVRPAMAVLLLCLAAQPAR